MPETEHNWEHLEPPLQKLDAELRVAMRGPNPSPTLAERTFESSVDHVIGGQLSDQLRSSLAVTPPANLADRVVAAAGAPRGPRKSHRSVLAKIGGIAVAAGLLLAAGVAIQLATTAPQTTNQPGPAVAMVAEPDPYEFENFDPFEWAFVSNDLVRLEVSALAEDLHYLTYAETDAALEAEFTRQMYYYELAEPTLGAF